MHREGRARGTKGVQLWRRPSRSRNHIISTIHCRLNARPLHHGRYLVTSPDFPRAAVEIAVPDADEALARAVLWLVGSVVGRLRDG